MAKRVVNRKELRRQVDAAEGAAAATEEKPAKAKAKPRASRAKKVPKRVRLKAFWGVFDGSMKRVGLFEYSQREEADERAKELAAKKSSSFFVQQVKEVVEDDTPEE